MLHAASWRGCSASELGVWESPAQPCACIARCEARAGLVAPNAKAQTQPALKSPATFLQGFRHVFLDK